MPPNFFEDVYQLEQTIFGDAHVALLGTLNVLCHLAEAKQNHNGLIGYRERQLTVTEKLYGKDDFRTGDAARAATDTKQRAELTPNQQAQMVKADELGARALEAYQSGNYTAGIAVITEQGNLRKQILGKQHPSYANKLNNLARLYHSMGDYPRAEPLFR